ncbi:MAG: permease [Candidatus Promineifilaceae bacterium]|nr:permease [Candidatus Promineifilaceae bacterium]
MKDRTTWILGGVALILALLAWRQGGLQAVGAGLIAGGEILLSVVPLLIAAFLIAGLIQVLVSRETVTRWLGAESGWRGIALACVGGALIPGGPYVYYPIAAVLMKSGASLGVLVAFVTAKNLWSVSRLPLEFALLGPELTVVRFGVTFLAPPLLGIAAEGLFGRYVAEIRRGVTA